jgi:hypothetical protein
VDWQEQTGRPIEELIKTGRGKGKEGRAKPSAPKLSPFSLPSLPFSIKMTHYLHLITPRVDVYLPLTATVKVSIGDKVSATPTILAKLA